MKFDLKESLRASDTPKRYHITMRNKIYPEVDQAVKRSPRQSITSERYKGETHKEHRKNEDLDPFKRKPGYVYTSPSKAHAKKEGVQQRIASPKLAPTSPYVCTKQLMHRISQITGPTAR
jgi:hypothetical protein